MLCPPQGQSFMLAVRERLDSNGALLSADSFDSGDPDYSDNGWYPTNNLNKTKANGIVCSASGLEASLNLTNAVIKGYVRTAAGTNTVYLGPGSSVGDRSWVEGGSLGIQPGKLITDFNDSFRPVWVSVLGWLPPPLANMNLDGVLYQYVLSEGWNYYVGSLTGSLLINAPSNSVVRLAIDCDIVLSTNQVIRIAPTGCKVSIYMLGSSFSLADSSRIDNQSGLAYKLLFFGLPTCTNISFGTNAAFCGTIYAPSADFTLGGGGTNACEFIGSSVTRTLTLTGNLNFHADEHLGAPVPVRPEITNQPVSRIVLPGRDATFTVGATGPSLAFQWRFNGIAIPDATNTSITISNVNALKVGDYSVVVTNSWGNLMSGTASLKLAGSPSMSSIGLKPGAFTFEFSTEPGPTYVVEYTETLPAVSWQLLTSVAGTGAPMVITDSSPSATARFYRVRLSD